MSLIGFAPTPPKGYGPQPYAAASYATDSCWSYYYSYAPALVNLFTVKKFLDVFFRPQPYTSTLSLFFGDEVHAPALSAFVTVTLTVRTVLRRRTHRHPACPNGAYGSKTWTTRRS